MSLSSPINQINETLLDKSEIQNNTIISNNLFCCFKRKNKIKERRINLNKENKTIHSNVIKNHRYNFVTFLPFIIFEQLNFFSNQFYIALLISQCFDWFKVGFIADYLIPVIIVFTITFIKEFFDDLQRHKKDNELNNQLVTKITKSGKIQIKSRNVKIGDFLEINKNERIPADLILIKTDLENGTIYIKTDQLDGETDWKLRKPIHSTQLMNLQEIFEKEGLIKYDLPSTFIYEFKGVFIQYKNNEEFSQDSLSLENTIWANTVLASDHCIGIVIFTGKETRAQMNSSQPRAKFTKLDMEVNFYNKILFVMMLLLAFSILALRGFNCKFILNIVSLIRFLVILCAILPISLRVNLEIAKTVNSYIINKNHYTPETIVRNSTIPEELGRIEFVFTDKTGTLTKNEMKFKQISFDENFSVTNENLEDSKNQITEEISKRNSLNHLLQNSFDSEISIESSSGGRSRKRSRFKRENIGKLIDSVIALAICNNVTPIRNEKSKKSDFNYQASSPDELALVDIAKNLGMTLIYRDEKEIRLQNNLNEIESFEILACFPFTSENKRMGILIRNKRDSTIRFYLKGSENVMMNFVENEYIPVIKEQTENLATRGLRTLAVTQKIISDEFYENWIKKYKLAILSIENRKEKLSEVISKLENKMEFLCITGVEDSLQENVIETIESLKHAGIKIWMLTGDKVETATCVAVSAGIKGKSDSLFYIKENYDKNYIEEKLNEFSILHNQVLIIDGDCLDVALNNYEKLFFTSAIDARSVVCCRCSPTQKAKIIKIIKKYTNKRTLAIGDGGNDVAMIQEANCGIGIVGKEGKQASLAADFSITEFHHLRILLLWFGRQSYKNTSSICQFVVQRGMIIAFMQYLFCMMFYYFPIPLYNGFLIMGYTSIFTNFPVFSLLLDRDTKILNVIKFPPLYKQLQKGRELNFKIFLYWTLVSLFQSSVIMFGSIFLFKDQIYIKIVSITFTNLIFAELLNIYTQIKHFHWLMVFSLIGTLVTYITTLFFLPTYIDFYYILQGWTLLKIFSIALINWIPFFLIRKIQKKLYPEHHEKLNNLKKSMVE